MKFTLVLACVLAISGFGSGSPFNTSRCGNMTITSRSSFVGDSGHEIQVKTATCADRHNFGDDNESQLTKRAGAGACLPDPAACTVENCITAPLGATFVSDCNILLNELITFAPNFTTLAQDPLYLTYHSCLVFFYPLATGPPVAPICGSTLVHKSFIVPSYALVGQSILRQCPTVPGGAALCPGDVLIKVFNDPSTA
ncbi:hypothetical protein B0H12DRAFT_1080881 [Mycena haematopus]|nr:hypothetical protein B0H12DRAFT_1080881 [Mycena haematopus]